jgi:glyceraldehyde 3-phosphate dehydrogenase
LVEYVVRKRKARQNTGSDFMKIAINGFGRIGKTFLRTLLLDEKNLKKLDVVAINVGPGTIDNVAHSFKYDTLMGTFAGSVQLTGSTLTINGHAIELLAEPDPTKIDWKKRSIDWVLEASGHFTKQDKALLHINPAGASHVLITAPATGANIVTIIPGINDDMFNSERDLLVSLGSCTTNALIPLLKVLDDEFGILQSCMTTVHAYTNSQVLLDVQTDDPRRSRAAALNIVPTTTGVTSIVDKVLPGMGNKFIGMSLRVPVGKVSIVDLVFTSKKDLTPEKINNALKFAAEHDLLSIMAFTTEPLVSSDFYNDPHSVIVDGLLTNSQDKTGKVFGWYDNEWGYCQRLKDFLLRHA